MKLRRMLLGTITAVGLSVMTVTASSARNNVLITQAATVQLLKQVNASSTYVEILGSNIVSTDRYTAFYSTDGGVTWKDAYATVNSQSSQIKVSGLNAGTHYDIKIKSEQYGESNIVKAVTQVESSGITAKQVSATTHSATISWEQVQGADGYELRVGDVVVGRTKELTYEVTSGFSAETYTQINIFPYLETTDYCAMNTFESGYVYAYLQPAKPTTVLERWYKYVQSIDIKIDTPSYYEGQEVCFYNAKGKEIQSGSSKTLGNASMNSVYSAKSRIYITINGQKLYSEWSDKMYAVAQPEVKVTNVTTKNKARNLKISWTKIKGAEKYDIYVSASGAKNEKFKKVASVSAKKKSYTVKKIAGKKIPKNKKQYVYVVAKKKIGDQMMKSSHVYCYSVGGENYTEE